MRRTRKPPAEPPSSDPSDGEVANTSRWRRALAPVTEELERASWVARWVVEAPSRWLGRRSTVGQDLTGTTDGLSYLRHLARGNRIRRQVSFENLDPDKPPVLLIHGFLGTRGSMYLLEHRLVEDGFVVVSFNIGTLNVRDIRRSAFMIHRKIERILAQTPFQKIDIVGHSMGGLIGLYYVKKLGGHERVRRLVMMGTPLRGTWAALAGVATLGLWSTSSWQLLPRSRFLDELAQGPLPPGVEIATLAAARDWVVPLKTTRLPGTSAVTVPLGHSSLVVSEDVYRRLIGILRDPPAVGKAAASTTAPRRDRDDDDAAGTEAALPDELAAARKRRR
ncbi:MAG: alpha/beta fold hydrolase [Myxococcales bacterium]|nr:alpha/beta fold hydrolase [Myxococcales bacterium]